MKSTQPQRLSPAVTTRRRSNRWWFKLAATSFTIKLVLVAGLFLSLKWAADAASEDAKTRGSSAGAEIRSAGETPR